ncbi:MAG: TadE family protein [Methylobacter sp.]
MNFRNKSKGAVLIEFALVLPFLLFLTVGIIELSNAFMAFNNLNKSVRDGISYLSRHAINATNNGIEITSSDKTTTENLILINFNTTKVALDHPLAVNDLRPTRGDMIAVGTTHIKIYATYNYNLFLGILLNDLTGFFGGSFPTTIPLTASAVYRVR